MKLTTAIRTTRANDIITGFPLITTGGDVIVQWDNGSFKIFSL